MTIDVNEQYECTGNKDNTCSALGCVFYLPHKNEFIVCPRFKLKKEFVIYKK